MARDKLSDTVNDLFARGKWAEARKLLEGEREKDPKSHWVLTQLGVTYFEQRRHEEALRLFQESQKIVDDCPLTLWNLAGTLDALGKPEEAIPIYRWLLKSNTSPEEDPCWESKDWTAALKADCVYRLGVCFQHLGKKPTAEDCYRRYIDLLLIGIDGSYSIEDVLRQIRGLHGVGKNGGAENELRKVVVSTLKVSRTESKKNQRGKPPAAHTGERIPVRRVATKGQPK